MKKLLLIPLLLLTVLSMAACGGGDDEPFRPGQPETPDVSSLNVNITVGPYRYRYDGRQCRRTGFPLSPAS